MKKALSELNNKFQSTTSPLSTQYPKISDAAWFQKNLNPSNSKYSP